MGVDVFIDKKLYFSELFIPLLNKRNTRGLKWVAEVLQKRAYRHFDPPLEPVIDSEIQVREALKNDPND